MPRPLNKIAAEILILWRSNASNPATRKSFHIFATPYAEAMLELSQISDHYGLDDAEDIILRFLCNTNHWRGDNAIRIKNELKAHLKEKSNAGNHSK